MSNVYHTLMPKSKLNGNLCGIYVCILCIKKPTKIEIHKMILSYNKFCLYFRVRFDEMLLSKVVFRIYSSLLLNRMDTRRKISYTKCNLFYTHTKNNHQHKGYQM